MTARTEAQAAFALRLVADLMTALVITERLDEKLAMLLIDDATKAVVASDPEHEELLRETAAALSAQIALLKADLRHRLRKSDED
ncbi:MAG: hypothetical protein V4618_13400 [Pseudomonadota bacterium]